MRHVGEWRFGWLIVSGLLGIAVLAVQAGFAVIGLVYCGEGRGTQATRDALCETAESGGYIALLALPPVIVLAGGVLAHRRRDGRFVAGALAIALCLGLVLPYVVGAAAGTR